jgi:hypothetical protein
MLSFFDLEHLTRIQLIPLQCGMLQSILRPAKAGIITNKGAKTGILRQQGRQAAREI